MPKLPRALPTEQPAKRRVIFSYRALSLSLSLFFMSLSPLLNLNPFATIAYYTSAV